MFQTGGGGGFDLPMRGSPVEILIMLLILAAVVWVAFRLFSS